MLALNKLLVFVFFICTYSTSLLSSQTIPTIDVQKELIDGKTSLAGQWALSWGEWTPLADIAASKANFKVVLLPNFVSSIVDEKALNTHRFGTYTLKLNNLSDAFQKPVIRMRNVNDAWQAWWIDESGQSQFLGESGKIAKKL
tara:strand:+ start:3014 stop:3442 length:429 start_codon:yes stop_codon:yes gene_type:complete